ncbi:hypothetical protein ABE444_08500 [Brevundimonas pondensis]|uniref:hypothetical protein n=1 Tax=Brevundimonas pondensis TaxID=2774189 RepID=UPI0032093D60
MSDAENQSKPFARGQVQWGRPSPTVFRTGPLPRGAGLTPPPLQSETPAVQAPKTEAPKAGPRPAAAVGGVFGGSLVPQRRSRQPNITSSLLTAPMPGRQHQPLSQPPLQAAPAVPADMTPRPLPKVPLAAVTPQPVAPSVARSAMPAPEPEAPRIQTARAQEAQVSAPVAARAAKRSGVNRMPLYVAAAAVVVIGAPVVTWLITRSNSAPAPAARSVAPESLTVAAPLAVPAAAPADLAPVETATAAAVGEATTTPAPPARVASPRAVPAAASAATAAANAAPPAVVASVEPPPVVVIAPAPEPVEPSAPAPTAARPSQSDPDAPVVTKPQSLD